jgi:phage terminase large subunit
LKLNNEKKYNQVVLGGWTEAVEGRVFTNWKKCTFEDFLKLPFKSIYGIDWGGSDPFAIIETKFDKQAQTLYCHEWNYLSERKIHEKMTEIERQNFIFDGGVIVYMLKKLGIPKDAICICDSARRDNIETLGKHGWFNAIPVDKPPGSIEAGVTALQSINVVYTSSSAGIDLEYNNYAHKEDRLGTIEDKYIDMFNHAIDAIRYAYRFILKN